MSQPLSRSRIIREKLLAAIDRRGIDGCRPITLSFDVDGLATTSAERRAALAELIRLNKVESSDGWAVSCDAKERERAFQAEAKRRGYRVAKGVPVVGTVTDGGKVQFEGARAGEGVGR